jgi:hypothetical protein
MDTTRIHDHDDTLDAHYSGLERLDSAATPCGCLGGMVFIGHMIEDPETAEEVEVFEAVPCRRCSGRRRVYSHY